MTISARSHHRNLVVEVAQTSPGGVGGSMATVWIDRPSRRNAVDTDTIGSLGDVMNELADHPDLAVVALRGVGGYFCAGADVGDLGALLQAPDHELEALFRRQLEVLDLWRQAPMMTVAILEGGALGFGVALSSVCDRVIAAHDSVLGLPEIQLGMAPAMVVDALLTRVAPRNALHLATSGKRIGATEALGLGLVDVVVARDATGVPSDAMWAAVVDDLGAAGSDRVDAVRQTVAMLRARRHGDPGDAAAQSVHALRSPHVVAALTAPRQH